MKAAPSPSRTKPRRSHCPIAASLDLSGDRWTLLVVRDLLGGPRRFRELIESVEGIPTNILSARLERLRAHGVIVRVEAAGGGKHLAHRLTSKGEALEAVIVAFDDWCASQAILRPGP